MSSAWSTMGVYVHSYFLPFHRHGRLDLKWVVLFRECNNINCPLIPRGWKMWPTPVYIVPLSFFPLSSLSTSTTTLLPLLHHPSSIVSNGFFSPHPNTFPPLTSKQTMIMIISYLCENNLGCTYTCERYIKQSVFVSFKSTEPAKKKTFITVNKIGL